jgi:cytidylate kinase
VPVITISRQYGSLGDEIGREVAERLGLRFVDQEIINEVARRLGVSPEAASAPDEREGSVVSELVHTMRRLYPATPLPQPSQENQELDEAAYLQVIREVIWEVARTNDAVIVGRGGAFILPKHPDILHVLIVAPLAVRVERVMAAEGLNQERAAQRLKHVDGNRGRYVRHFYHSNWLDLAHYDLVVNTGHFSQVRAASLICTAATAEQTTPPGQADEKDHPE